MSVRVPPPPLDADDQQQWQWLDEEPIDDASSTDPNESWSTPRQTSRSNNPSKEHSPKQTTHDICPLPAIRQQSVAVQSHRSAIDNSFFLQPIIATQSHRNVPPPAPKESKAQRSSWSLSSSESKTASLQPYKMREGDGFSDLEDAADARNRSSHQSHLDVGLGNTIGEHFQVERKLGAGSFSCVYLVRDLRCRGDSSSSAAIRYCAMKIFRAGDQFAASAHLEARMLAKVRGAERFFGALLDAITLKSDSDNDDDDDGWLPAAPTHRALVFDYVGPSLDVVVGKRAQALDVVAPIVEQLLEALTHLAKYGICHRDIKAANILVVAPPNYAALLAQETLWYRANSDSVPASMLGAKEYRERYSAPPTFQSPIRVADLTLRQARVKLIDFGTATDEPLDDDGMQSSWFATRYYRPPEALLQLPYDGRGDVWAVACLAYELAHGDYDRLFDIERMRNQRLSPDVRHATLMQRTVGLFPRRLVDRSSVALLLFERSTRRRVVAAATAAAAHDDEASYFVKRSLNHVPSSAHPFSHYCQRFLAKRVRSTGTPRGVYDCFVRLLSRMLKLDAHERVTAEQALGDEFFAMIGRDRSSS